MKYLIKFRNSAVSVACAAVLSGLSTTLVAQEEVYYGDRVPSKEELIDQLTPKPKYKTRGIQFGQPDVPKTEPSVSLAINFAYDSFELTPQAMQQLAPLGEALKSDQLSAFTFDIQGHTDASGSEAYNLSLSEKRALAVGSHLYSTYGIDPEKIQLTGKGESELYDKANPRSGVNRRVQISTLSAQQ